MANPSQYTDGQYLERNPDWNIGDSAWKAEQVLRMMRRHALEPKTVSEVGCGAGEILRVLHSKMPADVGFTGYEVSPQAYALCETRRQERLDFRLCDLIEADVRYDLLLIMDVIEHVEDVFGFLRRLRLKAEHKILHIPLDISALSAIGPTLMRGREAMGHIHYYTRATALATLRDTGYDVIDSFYTFGAIQSPGQKAVSLPAKALKLARRCAYLVSKELSVRVLGGASLLVLAK